MNTGCATLHVRRGVSIGYGRPDLRPPLVGAAAAADSLWGPMVESRSADGIAESRRADLEALVARFAPTLVLPNNDRAKVNGRRYWMLPTDVHLFADTLRLDVFRAAPVEFQDSANIDLRRVSGDSLVRIVNTALSYESGAETVAEAYFDFPGTSARAWWVAYGRFRTGPDSAAWATPTVYAHPFIAPDARLVIQYWFFYPINDFIGNHEGDWEHINVVVTADRRAIEEVHYYFHLRSVRLPQPGYQPEVVDGTHPVVYVGGRMYNVFDYPIRFFAGDHNEGSHGSYPFPGEWEGTAGLGGSETVAGADRDSLRVVPWQRFHVVLTPEPSRVDYRRDPEVLREWAWLLLPVRWGFPVSTSLGSELKGSDVGNRAPYGPAYSSGWNRTAPGFLFPGFTVRRLSRLQSFSEDLLQPWYYLYVFRTPRYVSDTRVRGRARDELEYLGLVPRGGRSEAGFGTTMFGLNLASPTGAFSGGYKRSDGILVWANLWGKLRLGALEVGAGYQKFWRRTTGTGTMYVYPLTAAYVLRAPDALFRPYIGAGGGLYGWQARVPLPSSSSYTASSGWGLGGMMTAGVEYYLRPKMALDVGVRVHTMHIDGARAGLASNRLQFVSLWIGHYFRL